MNGPGSMPPGFAPPPRPRLQPSGWQAEQDALNEQVERAERERDVLLRSDVVRVIR